MKSLVKTLQPILSILFKGSFFLRFLLSGYSGMMTLVKAFHHFNEDSDITWSEKGFVKFANALDRYSIMGFMSDGKAGVDKSIFNQFDEDRDGRMYFKEFSTVMTALTTLIRPCSNL